MAVEKEHSLCVRVAFATIVVVSAGAVLEGSSRLAYHHKGWVKSLLGMPARQNLNAYEMLDPARPAENWLLRPGVSMTLGEAIEEKRRTGRALAVRQIEERASNLGFEKGDTIYSINKDGFKGPEIDAGHSRRRILAIGDSCTFGSLFDRYSYPRAMERELGRLGKGAEVINAGVEGYHPANVLFRIEEFKSLRPDVTTIFIGWNALWGEPALGLEKYLYSARLIRSALRKLIYATAGSHRAAFLEYSKPKKPDRNDPRIRDVEGYAPSFISDIEKIIEGMRAAGSEVVLVTLPGLFVSEEVPGKKALEIGPLPTFIDNPYVYAAITERYNGILRELAKRHGLRVIDLEDWSKKAFRPRDEFFFDSVHLYEEGQEMMGRHMARELIPLLPDEVINHEDTQGH